MGVRDEDAAAADVADGVVGVMDQRVMSGAEEPAGADVGGTALAEGDVMVGVAPRGGPVAPDGGARAVADGEREALGDAKAERNVDALDDLLGMLRKEKRARYQALSGLLNGDGNSAAAADAVRQLMFIEKIERDTAEAIDRLED